jgi:hypothetical protein
LQVLKKMEAESGSEAGADKWVEEQNGRLLASAKLLRSVIG